MKELFLSYQLSLEMKEIGFDEPCFAHYYSDFYTGQDTHKNLMLNIIQSHQILDYKGWKNSTTGFGAWYVVAPLYQQAIDFFREKHGIHIKIDVQDIKENLYYFELLLKKEGDFKNEIEIKHDFPDYYSALQEAIVKAINIVKKQIKN